MRLLSDTPNKKILDLDIYQFSSEELAQKIKEFRPEVIFALSDDENPIVLDYALQHWCHMGFFKPYRGQLDEEKITQSKYDQLAKIIFLDQAHPDLEYFDQCGQVVHKKYLDECQKLLNFIFFCDTSD